MAIDTVAMRNFLAANYASHALFASLHSGDPQGIGANEIGSVARAVVSWGAPLNGEIEATVTWTQPGRLLVVSVGFWSASTAGTYLDSFAIPPTEVRQLDNSGSYTMDVRYLQV